MKTLYQSFDLHKMQIKVKQTIVQLERNQTCASFIIDTQIPNWCTNVAPFVLVHIAADIPGS
jgi:hypothetical protein